MSPQKRIEVLRALKLFGKAGATNRQLAKALGKHARTASHYTCALEKLGDIIDVGRSSEFAAERIFAINDGSPDIDTPNEPSIFEQCRQNWQGYRIHKIFGSAGRVTA